MSKKKNQVGSKTDKTNNKAPYSSPRLAPYGDIRELTQNSGNKGAPDNSTQKSDYHKTH
jgi:hypothetical protein